MSSSPVGSPNNSYLNNESISSINNTESFFELNESINNNSNINFINNSPVTPFDSALKTSNFFNNNSSNINSNDKETSTTLMVDYSDDYSSAKSNFNAWKEVKAISSINDFSTDSLDNSTFVLNDSENSSIQEIDQNSFVNYIDESFNTPKTPENKPTIWRSYFQNNTPTSGWDAYTMNQMGYSNEEITAEFGKKYKIALPKQSLTNPEDFAAIVKNKKTTKKIKDKIAVIKNNENIKLANFESAVLPDNIKDLDPRRLNLKNNKLTWIPKSFFNFSSLQYLNLKNNSFTNFSLEILNTLTLLRKIDLSFNKIAQVPEVITGEENIENLSGTVRIRNSKGNFIPLRDRNEIIKIDLTGNPLPAEIKTHSAGPINFIIRKA